MRPPRQYSSALRNTAAMPHHRLPPAGGVHEVALPRLGHAVRVADDRKPVTAAVTQQGGRQLCAAIIQDALPIQRHGGLGGGRGREWERQVRKAAGTAAAAAASGGGTWPLQHAGRPNADANMQTRSRGAGIELPDRPSCCCCAHLRLLQGSAVGWGRSAGTGRGRAAAARPARRQFERPSRTARRWIGGASVARGKARGSAGGSLPWYAAVT